MSVADDIKAIAVGFGVTLRHMLRRPVTIQYPEEKRTPYPRFRARIVLTHDPDGGERCVACYLCSAACPVDCISMQSAEGEGGAGTLPGSGSTFRAASSAACAPRPVRPWLSR